MDHPAMNGMDPVKLELIRLAAKQNRRQKRKITGSCDDGTHHQRKPKKGSSSLRREMSLILDILKEGRPAKEQEQIDQMVQMVRTHMKNHT